MRRRGPRERYRLAGAATIRHDLACLGYEPLLSIQTIERVTREHLDAGCRVGQVAATETAEKAVRGPGEQSSRDSFLEWRGSAIRGRANFLDT